MTSTVAPPASQSEVLTRGSILWTFSAIAAWAICSWLKDSSRKIWSSSSRVRRDRYRYITATNKMHRAQTDQITGTILHLQEVCGPSYRRVREGKRGFVSSGAVRKHHSVLLPMFW